jgi:hypothetical protein
MDKNNFKSFLVLGITLGLGIALAGVSMSYSFYKTRVTERFVTVKGLAERNVEADLAIWPLSFKETGNNLTALQKVVDSKRQVIREFLLTAGFEDEEISLSVPSIRDAEAEPMYREGTKPMFRYTAQQTISVRSSKVELVKQTMEKTGTLVSQGVVLSAGRSADFLFVSLNTIKPDMIAEATLNARTAAEQFAHDSGSKVGKIRAARQGLFSINVRDRNSPELKIVRVVNTVEYYIVD